MGNDSPDMAPDNGRLSDDEGVLNSVTCTSHKVALVDFEVTDDKATVITSNVGSPK